MIKLLILSSIFAAQGAAASTHLVCGDFGNMDGTYVLDITGYEQILNGTQISMTRTLEFKRFRSWGEKIADLACARPNPFLDGPRSLMACRSGPVSDYGDNSKIFEATLSQGQFELALNLNGPGIPLGHSVPCREQD